MATILRSVGNQFRVVGPLTVANMVLNPGMESVTSNVPNGWVAVGPNVVLESSSDAAPGSGKLSAKVTLPSDTGFKGVASTITYPAVPGAYFYMTVSFKLTSPLSQPLQVQAVFRDVNTNQVGPTVYTNLSLGSITSGWQQASVVTPVPDPAIWVTFAIGSTATSGFFYLDNVLTRPSFIANQTYPYVDGDYAGYTWQGTPHASQTLQSTEPKQFMRFDSDLNPVPFVS